MDNWWLLIFLINAVEYLPFLNEQIVLIQDINKMEVILFATLHAMQLVK